MHQSMTGVSHETIKKLLILDPYTVYNFGGLRNTREVMSEGGVTS